MPRFEHDPANVVATLEVLPKDTYEFIIGQPKSFFRQNAKGGDSYGIRYPLVVAEGPMKDKKVLFSTYFQSEGAQAVGKQFLMAGYGFGRTSGDEKVFNQQYAGSDFGFDTDTASVGEMYAELRGKRIVGDLDVRLNETNGEQQQDFKGWKPFGK